MDRGAKELSGGGFPPKAKQSANGSALLGVPTIPLFFPYGSLVLGIEPGPKRCTSIRELINIL